MTFEGPKDEQWEDPDEDEGDGEHYAGEEWKGGDYDPDDDKRWKNESENQNDNKDDESPKPPKGPTENVRRKLGQTDAEAEKLAREEKQLEKSALQLILEKVQELERELQIINEMIADGIDTPKDHERKEVILKKLKDLRPNSM